MNVTLPLRPELAGLSPYGAPQLQVDCPLNVNENPYAPAPEVMESIAAAVHQAAGTLNRYPERDFWFLRQELAAYLQAESGVSLRPEQIWAGNGSNEVILHLLQAYAGPGRVVLTFSPSYSMYPEYARDTASTFVAGERNTDFSLDMAQVKAKLEELRPSVLLLASPNNPTGTALSLEDTEQILQWAKDLGPQLPAGTGTNLADGGKGAASSPGDPSPRGTACIVLVDEAYAEFRRPGTPSALQLLEKYPHLVVCRTMSKAFGMAGLRLGYMAASQELLAGLQVVRLPYHLSAVTQAAALAALSHRDSLMAQVAQLRAERDALVQWLMAQGYQVAPSDANFVMFGVFSNRREVWQGLLEHSVLIREVGPPGWLRVSVGTGQEMEQFKTALMKVDKR